MCGWWDVPAPSTRATSAWEYVWSIVGLGATVEPEPEPEPPRSSIAAAENGAATGWESGAPHDPVASGTAAGPPGLPGLSGCEELELLLRRVAGDWAVRCGDSSGYLNLECSEHDMPPSPDVDGANNDDHGLRMSMVGDLTFGEDSMEVCSAPASLHGGMW